MKNPELSVRKIVNVCLYWFQIEKSLQHRLTLTLYKNKAAWSLCTHVAKYAKQYIVPSTDKLQTAVLFSSFPKDFSWQSTSHNDKSVFRNKFIAELLSFYKNFSTQLMTFFINKLRPLTKTLKNSCSKKQIYSKS